jgi:peptide-methionine (S)-S-oxide reductase
MKSSAKEKTETATFGAGCFWQVEEDFRHTKGVLSTEVGFMGGNVKRPSYEQVCTDKTGHAEVVQLEFNPSEVSYEELLSIFWENHDPTTPNRQGPDVGSQYRSVIFFHSPAQKETAVKSKKAIEKSGKFRDSVVTEIIPASEFYKAEKYHQKYIARRVRGTEP